LISIAIVDDHWVLVDSLTLMLGQEPDFAFLGSADTLAKGRELLKRISPDVLLLDVSLPDGNGLDLVKEIHEFGSETKIIVLTSYTDESTLMKAIDLGVNGFLSKNASLKELLVTIRQVAEGEIAMPTSLLMGLIMRMPRDKNAAYREEKGWERLTLREQEILEQLARGKSGEAISEELHIAPLTVRTHIRNLMSKLGVHTRLEAEAFALKNGMIENP
jgi:NarL family two-component system response regulator LiaR